MNPDDGTIRWEFDTGNKIRALVETSDGVCAGNFSSETYRVTIDGTEEWKHTGAGGRPNSPPVVAEERVFIGGPDAKLHALDEVDGRHLWAQGTEQPIQGGCAVENGRVFLKATKTGAFDAASGSLLWGFRPLAGSDTNPVLANGVLYICETSGLVDRTVYAVDTENGEVLWEQETDTRLRASPAVKDGVLCTGSQAGTIYGINAESGQIRWDVSTNGVVEAAPTIKDGSVYVGSRNGELYNLNLQDGDRQWLDRSMDPIRASPAIADDVLYVATLNSFHAIELPNRNERWSKYSTGAIAAPAVGDGFVYFGDSDAVVRALDRKTGDEVASFQTGRGSIRSGLAAVNGTVYVGGSDGTLYALDSRQ